MGGRYLLVVAARGRHWPQRQQKLRNTGITKTSQLVALRLRSDPMNRLQSSAASEVHWAREQSMHVFSLLVVLIEQLRLGAVCFGPPLTIWSMIAHAVNTGVADACVRIKGA